MGSTASDYSVLCSYPDGTLETISAYRGMSVAQLFMDMCQIMMLIPSNYVYQVYTSQFTDSGSVACNGSDKVEDLGIRYIRLIPRIFVTKNEKKETEISVINEATGVAVSLKIDIDTTVDQLARKCRRFFNLSEDHDLFHATNPSNLSLHYPITVYGSGILIIGKRARRRCRKFFANVAGHFRKPRTAHKPEVEDDPHNRPKIHLKKKQRRAPSPPTLPQEPAEIPEETSQMLRDFNEIKTRFEGDYVAYDEYTFTPSKRTEESPRYSLTGEDCGGSLRPSDIKILNEYRKQHVTNSLTNSRASRDTALSCVSGDCLEEEPVLCSGRDAPCGENKESMVSPRMMKFFIPRPYLTNSE